MRFLRFIILGFPEIGFHVHLRNLITATSGWTKLTGWEVPAGTNGPYNIDADLTTSDVSIPITAIYFVSASVSVSNIDNGKFTFALIVNGDTEDTKIGLKSSLEQYSGGRHTLAISGFVKLYAGETVSIQLHSSTDTSYAIERASSFSFHNIGPPGSVPAYLAQVRDDTPFNSDSVIKPWITEGRAKLYRSLSGKCNIIIKAISRTTQF